MSVKRKTNEKPVDSDRPCNVGCLAWSATRSNWSVCPSAVMTVIPALSILRPVPYGIPRSLFRPCGPRSPLDSTASSRAFDWLSDCRHVDALKRHCSGLLAPRSPPVGNTTPGALANSLSGTRDCPRESWRVVAPAFAYCRAVSQRRITAGLLRLVPPSHASTPLPRGKLCVGDAGHKRP